MAKQITIRIKYTETTIKPLPYRTHTHNHFIFISSSVQHWRITHAGCAFVRHTISTLRIRLVLTRVVRRRANWVVGRSVCADAYIAHSHEPISFVHTCGRWFYSFLIHLNRSTMTCADVIGTGRLHCCQLPILRIIHTVLRCECGSLVQWESWHTWLCSHVHSFNRLWNRIEVESRIRVTASLSIIWFREARLVSVYELKNQVAQQKF